MENFSTFIDGVSSKPTEKKKGKAGRPATGRKTGIIRASVPLWLIDEAKKAAFEGGETFSGLVTRSVHSVILQRKPKP